MKAYCHTCKQERQIPCNPGPDDRLCPRCKTRLSQPPRERKPLERKRRPRRRVPDRVWDQARAKVEEEAACRVCGKSVHLEAAHVIDRTRDGFHPVNGDPLPQPWMVEPDRIVPLCGPSSDPTSCHGRYDYGQLDLLGHLTVDEEVQAIRDSHTIGTRESGLELARVRLAPTLYRKAAA